MKVHVDVTVQDIANGHASECQRCPIALALHRAAPEYIAEVYQFHAWLLTPGALSRRMEAKLPEAAANFILLFDEGEGGQPFSFELDFPDQEDAA